MPEQSEQQPAPENWYTEGAGDLPFVAISHTTTGESAEHPERTPVAGNMSVSHAQPEQPDLSPEERRVEAKIRINAFLESLKLEPSHTAIMNPQNDFSHPVGIINIDEAFRPGENGDDATVLPERGDFLYTRNPEVILGCKPADCPCLIGEGLDRNGQKLLFLQHLAWMELDAGYLEQGLAFLAGEGVETSSLRLYLTRGARTESYGYYNPDNPFEGGDRQVVHPKREELFVNLHKEPIDSGEEWWFWNVDTFGFIRNRLHEAGVQDGQIYEDPTDVASPASGNSSNNRQFNTGEMRSSDLVVATMKPGAGSISYPSAK